MAERRASVASAMSWVTSPVVGLRRLAVRRGVVGGSRPWMLVAGVLWGARLLRRASTRRPEAVSLERLRPGETLQVTAIERGRRSAGR